MDPTILDPLQVEIKNLHPIHDFTLTYTSDGRRLYQDVDPDSIHKTRGNIVQPHPDKLSLSFKTLGEDFKYDLQVMHELFGEDGGETRIHKKCLETCTKLTLHVISLTATILSSSSTKISEPHRLTSYSVHLPDGFATLTIHSPSQIHGLIYKNNILYQIDHISRHRESLNEHEGRRLSGVEMVAFKRGERFVKREEANCREPEDGREEDHEHHEHGHGHGHEDLHLGHSPDEEVRPLPP